MLDRYEPQFLLLQLYYLYVKFRHLRVDQPSLPRLQFKDEGRTPPQLEQRDESEVHSGDDEMQIIEEEDSLDFDSSRRSKVESGPHSIITQPTPPHAHQSPARLQQTRELYANEIMLPPQ